MVAERVYKFVSSVLRSPSVEPSGGVALMAWLAALLALAPVVLGSAHAQTQVITFDGLNASGGEVTGAPVVDYLARFGVTVTPGAGSTVFVDSVTALPFITTHGTTNFLGSGGVPTSYSLTFNQPVTAISFGVAGGSGVFWPQWSIDLYDTSNNLIGSVGFPLGGFPGSPQTYSFSGDISRVTVSGNDFNRAGASSVYLDTITLTLVPQKSVVIDPGHGKILQNGILTFQRPPSPTFGLIEDELTLEISNSLRAELVAANVSVQLTRESDLAPFAPANCVVPCFADINKRVRWAENQEPDLLVSVHTNAGPPTANGSEAFYSTQSPSPNSLSLAQFVLSRVVALGLRDRGVKQTNFNIINTNMPSTLIEVAFHSNSTLAVGETVTDETRLNDPHFLSSAASAISDGVEDYYDAR